MKFILQQSAHWSDPIGEEAVIPLVKTVNNFRCKINIITILAPNQVSFPSWGADHTQMGSNVESRERDQPIQNRPHATTFETKDFCVPEPCPDETRPFLPVFLDVWSSWPFVTTLVSWLRILHGWYDLFEVS